jgi:hypothetical protein
MRNFSIALVSIVALGSSALADTPTLGGPMSHLLVTLFQNQVFITFESPDMATVDMQDNSGAFGGDYGVLNNMGYNAQFGWLANGFISLPPSSGIFVRTITISDHLFAYEQDSLNPIMGTDDTSDIWQWDGTMTHNWYATDVHGPHMASYEVFVGDLSGNPRDGFQSGFVDLNFQYGPDFSGRVGTLGSSQLNPTPSPGTLGLMFASAIMVSGRKR